MGRDSILLKLMSRRAKTLSDLNNAPGRFLTLKAMEVLLAPGGIIRRYAYSKQFETKGVGFPTARCFWEERGFCFRELLPLRIRKNRVKFRLSSSTPACKI